MSTPVIAQKSNGGVIQATPQTCHNQLWLKISLVVLGVLLIGGCIALHLCQVNAIAVYSTGGVGGVLVVATSLAILIQSCRQRSAAKAVEALRGNTPEKWQALARQGDAKAIQRGLEAGFINDPAALFSLAASYSNVEVLNVLLAQGVDLKDQCPLHCVVMLQNEQQGLAMMEKLLAQDPALISTKDKNLNTPLHRAGYIGHKKQVDLLLSHHADVHATNNGGRTPLLEASCFCVGQNPNIELIEALLRAGARLDVTAHDHTTFSGWLSTYHTEWFNRPEIQQRITAATQK